jgi:hypothetical protein
MLRQYSNPPVLRVFTVSGFLGIMALITGLVMLPLFFAWH